MRRLSNWLGALLALVAASASCSNGASTHDGGASATNADTQDGGACVDLNPSDFDRSCNSDGDCIEAYSGHVCSNGPLCMCPFGAINVRDQSKYDAQYQAALTTIRDAEDSGVPFMCGCPRSGAPRCFANRCVMCGGAVSDPSCPDGG
jgi:hypothetical protein